MMMLTNASQGTMAAEWQRRPTRWPSTIISWILGCLMLWRVKSWRREQMKVAADYIAGSLWEGSADGQPPLTPDEYGFTGIQKKEWAKKLAETGSVSCHQLESHTSIIR
eukprot:m.37977 g.37977  ORF g.37977 m.37977 type:complete len:109 (-) comp17803_c0_seq1:176-502(-)